MGIGRVRRVALAVLGASLAVAIPCPTRAGGKPKSLGDFLPPRLGSAEAGPPMILGPDRVGRSYVVKDDAGAAPRDVRITLVIAPDERELAEALAVGKVGETHQLYDGLLAEGLRIDGRFVQRSCGSPGSRCRVDVVLAKRMLLVDLDIERPADGDEALLWLKLLDLKGMEAFAHKQGPAIVAAHRRSEGKSRERPVGWIRDNVPRASGPPPAPVEKLSSEQIDRVLSARAHFRACYEKEASRNPALQGGDIVVTFSVAPNGRVTDAKVQSSTVRDPQVEGCVIRMLRVVPFPPTRVSTQASYTFAFEAPDAGVAR